MFSMVYYFHLKASSSSYPLYTHVSLTKINFQNNPSDVLHKYYNVTFFLMNHVSDKKKPGSNSVSQMTFCNSIVKTIDKQINQTSFEQLCFVVFY